MSAVTHDMNDEAHVLACVFCFARSGALAATRAGENQYPPEGVRFSATSQSGFRYTVLRYSRSTDPAKYAACPHGVSYLREYVQRDGLPKGTIFVSSCDLGSCTTTWRLDAPMKDGYVLLRRNEPMRPLVLYIAPIADLAIMGDVPYDQMQGCHVDLMYTRTVQDGGRVPTRMTEDMTRLAFLEWKRKGILP